MAFIASVGRIGVRGKYGTLSSAIARKMSGRNSAEFHATGAPQSWPTITADSTPRLLTSPTISPTRFKMLYDSIGSGASVCP